MSNHKDTAGPGADPALERLLVFLRDYRGFDFTGYKRASLGRRITGRMRALGLDSFEAYQDRLEADPDEFSSLFDYILINVTGFFRDPEAWEVLEERVLPRILEDKSATDRVRVWSAGCSSGEEPYTLAMLLDRAMGTEAFRERVKIYATDADEAALERARHASYAEPALESVPEELRAAYFTPVGNGQYGFRSDLRRQVIFGRHDLNADAPISNLDLLVCRNVLMYFDADAQARILARFQYALRDSGYLFAGRAETLMARSNLFLPVDVKARIFTKRFPGRFRRHTETVAGEPVDAGAEPPAAARLVDLALELSPMPQLVLDAQHRLALANEQARTLFGVTPGDLGQPFQDLEISYRPADLRSLIDSVQAGRRVVELEGMERQLDGRARHFNVVATRLGTLGEAKGVSLVFAEVTQAREVQQALERANAALEATRLQLQAANEEQETTNEELQSTNEELETTNEELQSTNEEMETMNEELQSTNEELETLNDELQQRADELNRANLYLDTVLSSLSAAVPVLDSELRVQSWNRAAEKLWGFQAAEVEGEFFLNLEIGLPVAELRSALKGVLRGADANLEQVLVARNRRGEQIHCRVTCVPMRGGAGAAEEPAGVVLTMEEWEGDTQHALRQSRAEPGRAP